MKIFERLLLMILAVAIIAATTLPVKIIPMKKPTQRPKHQVLLKPL